MTKRRRDAGPKNVHPAHRSWFRVGPGLGLAVLASVFVWMTAPRQPESLPAPPGAPADQTIAAQPSAPDPGWILENAEAFHLAPGQVADIRRLADRWDRETRDLRANLEAATTEFHSVMEARVGEGMPLGDVQRLALPVSALTRQLASARRAWWQEAGMHLSATQRKTVEDTWSRRLQRQSSGHPLSQVDTDAGLRDRWELMA